ncbi:MAG: tRNA (adenosine(37)-N6)-dimethylallyltransferase MiaA [Microthrixaceae bacterium]
MSPVESSGGSPRYPNRDLVLVGPTASGKSQVAMKLAERHLDAGGLVELISGDSMQVYRGMDIGTAKPSVDEQRRVRHHLIDLVEPNEEYSVAEFIPSARAALVDIDRRGGRGIVVGGTGLYIQALIDGLEIPGQYPVVRADLESEADTRLLHSRLAALDPLGASRMEPDNRRRILRALEVTIGSGRAFSDFGPGLDSFAPTDFVVVGLDIDRELLSQRIRERFMQQMADGFLDEVAELQGRGVVPSRTAAQALGYRELRDHLEGKLGLDEAVELAITRTRQFAVRQIRWFRRDPRIEFFEQRGDPGELAERIDRHWRAS